ncbi:MAG: TIGR02391 family protein [Thalassolituus sp. CG17_big_fil_post_rev_8_21_14_2_50_53_8]|nr:MAG: TIGR02391 family protein [Thalassolituus sp. CG17_big_fil_post_rev_8_21_14_2_50_53_8]
MKIYDLIDDPDVLLGLAPEELAFHLLRVARDNIQNGLVHRSSITSIEPVVGRDRPYPPNKEAEIRVALAEALNWLEVNALIIPDPGPNGQNGHMILGRRATQILERDQFDNFRRAASFPKSLLHPSIAEQAWISLARGEFADAVFNAFRTVEEQVRDAGGFEPVDVGVVLMRKAFNPDTGPLSDMAQPAAEREALMHLFAGSIGSYKNPHSHRTVQITDHVEAQEMVMLASHLLRIIDSRWGA